MPDSEDNPAPVRERVTLILDQAASGDAHASAELLPIVYDELRRLAHWRLQRERPGQTLQPTALVHEAYLRLIGGEEEATWENRKHFFAAAAEAMRRILIERARRYGRQKRGSGQQRDDGEVLDRIATPEGDFDPEDVLSLDEALSRLERVDADAALVAKLRHFSGFTVEEIAQAVGLSKRSVDRKWSFARAWLLRELSRR